MKITIKNLQQQTFCLDFNATNTVAELKLAILRDRGAEYTVERQKLIYAGVILEDERTLESYQVDEKKFIVVMLKRESNQINNNKLVTVKESAAITIPPLTTNTTTSTTTSTRASKTAECPVESAAAPLSRIDEPIVAESNLLMGDEYQRSVTSMIEMGYSRELVERAMAASFNNPERAVEYLISGIPETSDLGFIAPTTTTEIPEHGSTAVPREDPFEFLRNQPQFLQMRSLVYQNPDLLQAVLRQIGQTNPALLQLISENQDAFLQMLNQPLEGSGTTGGGGGGGATNTNEPNRRAQLEAVTRAVAGGTPATATATEITTTQTTARRDVIAPATGSVEGDGNQTLVFNLSSTDKQAIDRLKAMGFPEAMVLQAYFACEKDEQLAANFLISSAFDD